MPQIYNNYLRVSIESSHSEEITMVWDLTYFEFWSREDGSSKVLRNPQVYTLTFQSLLVTWYTNRFSIQQLYALPTMYLCVSYLSEDKQRLVPLTA